MRRFTGNENGMLLLAGLFIFGGMAIMANPTEMTIPHQAYKHVRSSIEHVSKNGSQIYGGVFALFGAGLVGLVFYGRRK
jgi:hypothetical protein